MKFVENRSILFGIALVVFIAIVVWMYLKKSDKTKPDKHVSFAQPESDSIDDSFEDLDNNEEYYV